MINKDIINNLSFKYKIIDNKLIIYKNFTTKELNELYKKYTYNEILDTLIEFIETTKKDYKRQNLLGTSILKNFKKCNKNIENGNIENNLYNVDLYYTDFKDVEHLLNKINENYIINELQL